VKLVIDNDIIVSGINKETKSQLKRDTSFINPEYQDAVKFKRSTYGIKKMIRLYKDVNNTLILPRGCFYKVLAAAKEEPSFEFKTAIFEKITIKSNIKLRPLQGPWAEQALNHINGMCIAPAGSGKTVLALHMISELGQPTLWLTHRQTLIDQLIERAEQFLDIGKIGILGDGKFEYGDVITAGMVQTLVKKDLSEIYGKFGTVVIDEAHNLPADGFTKVARKLNPHYMYGLTATPYREDRLEQIMYDIVGPTITKMSRKQVIEAGGIIPAKVIVRKLPGKLYKNSKDYTKIIRYLESNEKRNNIIISDILIEIALGNTCIALTNRVNHGAILKDMLKDLGVDSEHIHSKTSNKVKQAAIVRFKLGEVPLLIATYRMLGEGFDHQSTNRIFFTLPHKARGLIEQAKGRIERTADGKTDALLYDYVDVDIPMLYRQFEARLEQYENHELDILET